jgi:ribosomal protein S18 acetylase RimI-like enzyme
MSVIYQEVGNPNSEELKDFLEVAFDEKGEQAHAEVGIENHVGLDGWFSVGEMLGVLASHGVLLEARTPDSQLAGVLYMQKENPITWKDGRKMEIIIGAVRADLRRRGVGEHLLIDRF